jgi:hypothetical protein
MFAKFRKHNIRGSGPTHPGRRSAAMPFLSLPQQPPLLQESVRNRQFYGPGTTTGLTRRFPSGGEPGFVKLQSSRAAGCPGTGKTLPPGSAIRKPGARPI